MGCSQRLQTSGSLSCPLGRELQALGARLGWVGEAGSLPRTCQPPLALPLPMRFLPVTRGMGNDSGVAALRCILIQHRAPAGCLYIRGCVILLLAGKGSGGDNYVSLGRNIGTSSSLFLSALGEEMSIQHFTLEGDGVGKSV